MVTELPCHTSSFCYATLAATGNGVNSRMMGNSSSSVVRPSRGPTPSAELVGPSARRHERMPREVRPRRATTSATVAGRTDADGGGTSATGSRNPHPRLTSRVARARLAAWTTSSRCLPTVRHASTNMACSSALTSGRRVGLGLSGRPRAHSDAEFAPAPLEPRSSVQLQPGNRAAALRGRRLRGGACRARLPAE